MATMAEKIESSAEANYPVRDTLRYLDAASAYAWDPEFSPEEQRILNAINQKVAASQTLEEVMNFLFEATREICPCDRIGVALLEDDGRRVVAHWARATYEPVLLDKGFAQDLRGSSLEAVLRNGARGSGGSVRIISDLELYLKQHPESVSTRLIVKEGVRSSMTCPLVVEGRPVGFLFRSSRKPNAYDRHQVRLHQAVAERLSQTVEKAWRIEQLTSANRAYLDMLGFVSHELRNPLALIVMNAQGLIEGHWGVLEPAQREKLERMVGKAEFLLGLITDYLNLARVESGDLRANMQDGVDLVADVIGPSIDFVEGAMMEQRVTLHRDFPEAPMRISCDPSLLMIVVVNLLGNAAKYGESDGEIRLRAEQTDSVVRLCVWNRGPGFPPEERPKLFRKFSRLPIPELMKRKGTGVGLYTAWRIVQIHGGRIRAESKPGEWAEFIVELPRERSSHPANAVRTSSQTVDAQ